MTAAALTTAEPLLRAVGYEEADIRAEYPVWLGTGHGLARADAVAFGRRAPQDMSTATIVVADRYVDAGYLLAAAMATPYLVVVDEEVMDLWIAHSDQPHLWQEHITVADAPKLREWLDPAAALRAKVGLRQLPLFKLPVDLLATARSRGADRLSPIVADALSAAADAMPASRFRDPEVARQRSHRRAARVVVSAITALVTRDRQGMEASSTEELLSAVSEQYSTTFEWYSRAPRWERRLLAALVDSMGEGIDYRSLDPAILSEVYEDCLVNDDDRQQLGIHYTPPRLASRLLADMPVELVEPTQRNVLDPACGSGTLLVAAHDRLRELQPGHWTETTKHHDLAVHLRGFDIDPFAVEIAQLSLLLHAMPAGNGWLIDQRNTLGIDPVRPERELVEPPALADGQHRRALRSAKDSKRRPRETRQRIPFTRPSILVSNPPWRYTSRGGRRTQAADDFVRWSMDAIAPGGLLGLILPQSWLSSAHSSTLREEFGSRFDVFEIWRLPEGTFESSRLATCVLIARQRDGLGGHGARVVREVHQPCLDSFLDRGPATATYVLNRNNETSIPLRRSLPPPQTNVETVPLSSVATIRSGAQPKPGVFDRRSGFPYLHQFRAVQPYGSVQPELLWRVKFPDDFQTGRGAAIVDRRKVLVSAARNPSNPWQMKVAIDATGVIVRNSVRGVVPNDDDDDLLHALCIAIGSGFGATYAGSFGGERNVSAEVLNTFPVPTSARSISGLARLGRRARRCADQGLVDELRALLRSCEDFVWDAYGVGSVDRVAAERRLGGHAAPDGGVRYEPPSTLEPTASFSRLRRLGVVLSVEAQALRLWVNGITPNEGVVVAMPDGMPGWLARPGATFDVTGVDAAGDVRGGDFQLQPTSWSDLALDAEMPRPLQVS